MLDVTDTNCISNLRNYDILIHTATGNKTISDHIPLLLTKAKKYLYSLVNKALS